MSLPTKPVAELCQPSVLGMRRRRYEVESTWVPDSQWSESYCFATAFLTLDPGSLTMEPLTGLQGFDLCSIDGTTEGVVEARDSGLSSYSPFPVEDELFLSVQSSRGRDVPAVQFGRRPITTSRRQHWYRRRRRPRDFGHDLGLQTLAEGVETTDQIDHLRSESADSVQGFLLARPLDVDAIEAKGLEPRSRPAPRCIK